MSSMAFMLSATLFATLQTAPCQDLQSLSLPDATIDSVELVPAGPYVTQGFGGQQQTGPMLPEHCRVAAALTPVEGSHIEMEIWLPTATVDGPDRSVCRQSPAASVKGMRQPPTIRGTKAAAGSSGWANPKRSSISVTGRCTKWPCSPNRSSGSFTVRRPASLTTTVAPQAAGRD